MKKKVLSLFSGIGAFEKALQNLGIEFDLVNYCEIDKYASKSYSLIHNVSEDLNLNDVTKVNTDLLPHDIDLITYGYPCQDISQAGNSIVVQVLEKLLKALFEQTENKELQKFINEVLF